jgi:hypothetical protein
LTHQPPSKGITDLLKSISERLDEINLKLDQLRKAADIHHPASHDDAEALMALDVMTLLSLPDHLRKTAMILNRLNRATAGQVAQETKRARAVESSYLNQLVVMGHIHKTREGRDVYFYIE